MKAYVCTIGEKTTDICIEQLERYGFEVVVLAEKEPWPVKYKKFLELASKEKANCIRVDADVIVNKNVKIFERKNWDRYYMAQGTLFDFYRNDIFIGQPVWYSASCFQIILENFDQLDLIRPEASAWRLKQINDWTHNFDEIMGMHGFAQDQETMDRAYRNKALRKQMEHFDFELAHKILNL